MSQLDTISQEVPATGMEKFLEDNFRKLVWLFIIVVAALIAYGFIHHQSTLKANEAVMKKGTIKFEKEWFEI